MLQHYTDLKAIHPDKIIFYRVGEFYEILGNDAVHSAQVLGITLTKRRTLGGGYVQMCGVPRISLNTHIKNLIKHGNSVVICEKVAGNESMVRQITQIITPGTVLQEDLMDYDECNYICSFHKSKDVVTMIWTDVSIGTLYIKTLQSAHLELELTEIQPKELIIDKSETKPQIKCKIVQFKINNVQVQDNVPFTASEVKCMQLLSNYLNSLNIDVNLYNFKIRRMDEEGRAILPSFTQKSLNIFDSKNKYAKNKNALFGILNNTSTPMGSRLLMHQIMYPFRNTNAIKEKLDAIEFILHHQELPGLLTAQIGDIKGLDLERIIMRIRQNKHTIKDIIAMYKCMICMKNIVKVMEHYRNMPNLLVLLVMNISCFSDIVISLSSVITIEQSTEGSYIKQGYHPVLDEINLLRLSMISKIKAMCAKYIVKHELQGIKITHDKTHGYCIEFNRITNSEAKQLGFLMKKHTRNGYKYTTDELLQAEVELVRIECMLKSKELEIYADIRTLLLDQLDSLHIGIFALAEVDVILSLAEAARRYNYSKPNIVDNYVVEITGGRHPIMSEIVEGAVLENDCILNQDSNIMIITGPNMSGKSTYIKQNALICLMAQIGSFVPARHATIGAFDAIMVRAGLYDDIHGGRSSFMVEMQEVAFILNNATQNSIIMIDELCSGTCASEGAAIMIAIIHHIHDKLQCNTIISTHYKDLYKKIGKMPGVLLAQMEVLLVDEKLIFSYNLKQGTTSSSYGLKVAKMAGLSDCIIYNAEAALLD